MFAGIGAASHAIKQIMGSHHNDVHTYFFENNADARNQYLSRCLRHHFPQATIWEDAKILLDNNCHLIQEMAHHHSGATFYIIGGFPCQDLSGMGAKRGFHGTKSVLLFTLATIISAFQREVGVHNVIFVGKTSPP